VLVVAEVLPDDVRERNVAVGLPPPRVEFVAWTVPEWRRERARGNRIAVEAEGAGVWFVGSPETLR
jgi:hypothetical protein